MLCELLEEVDMEGSMCSERAVVSGVQFLSYIHQAVDTSGQARPRSKFTPSKQDVQAIKQYLYPKLEELWVMQRVEEGRNKKFEDPSYDIISGESENNLPNKISLKM